MSMQKSSRARGGNRGGGSGGTWERTDPDFDLVRIRRLRQEYDELPEAWKKTYLKGLSKLDQKLVLERDRSS